MGPRALTLLLALQCSCHIILPLEGQGGDSKDGDLELSPDGGRSETRWILVSSGIFHMGSELGEPCRMSTQDEQRHQVTLTRDFFIASHEVTQQQFAAAMGYSSPRAGRPLPGGERQLARGSGLLQRPLEETRSDRAPRHGLFL
jgi:formylglycine-generating enzyme required for sulfatase activity